VFDLVPPGCSKHISSIYAQLGHPQINFQSFWDVYNQLRDAVDAELLFQSSCGTFPEEQTGTPEDDPNVAELPPPESGIHENEPNVAEQPELPLSHLRPCRFGEDGVPPGRILEEGEIVISRITYTNAHISLDDGLVVTFTDDEDDEIF